MLGYENLECDGRAPNYKQFEISARIVMTWVWYTQTEIHTYIYTFVVARTLETIPGKISFLCHFHPKSFYHHLLRGKKFYGKVSRIV